jgi:hypothetical protein
MKRLLFALFIVAVVACGNTSANSPDGGTPGALQRPTELPRAPDGGLPDDLFPPR